MTNENKELVLKLKNSATRESSFFFIKIIFLKSSRLKSHSDLKIMNNEFPLKQLIIDIARASGRNDRSTNLTKALNGFPVVTFTGVFIGSAGAGVRTTPRTFSRRNII